MANPVTYSCTTPEIVGSISYGHGVEFLDDLGRVETGEAVGLQRRGGWFCRSVVDGPVEQPAKVNATAARNADAARRREWCLCSSCLSSLHRSCDCLWAQVKAAQQLGIRCDDHSGKGHQDRADRHRHHQADRGEDPGS